MQGQKTTWGVVATIKAPATEVLRFAAYHLDLGAHRVFIYLDEPNPAAYDPLKNHSKIRVFSCDDDFWARRKRKRPAKHQQRQTANAKHAYRRADVDWLAHIDVDEFIWPGKPLSDALGALPDSCFAARMRPIEALAGDDNLYKGFIPNGPDRDATVRALYPTFGSFVKGGFMSHVAGKIFARTGMEKVEFRIHNIFRDGEMNPGGVDLETVDLCHRHAHDWDHWLAVYRYRLSKGSYREELAPNKPRDRGGLSMHELLRSIEADSGETGLRNFFDELGARNPAVRNRLQDKGLLKTRDLDLDAKLRKHFPDFQFTVSKM